MTDAFHFKAMDTCTSALTSSREALLVVCVTARSTSSRRKDLANAGDMLFKGNSAIDGKGIS